MGISPRMSTNPMLVDSVLERRPVAALGPLHLLFLLSLALSALIWGATFILGGEGLQLQKYLGLLAFYAVSSAVFVVSRIRRDKLQLFEIPVYITVIFFFQFGLIPLRNFIDPTQLDVHLSANGEELVQALSYIILGMMAFWIACELFWHKECDGISAGPGTQGVVPELHKGRVLLPFAVLYGVGFIARVYLLENHMYSYLTSLEAYSANLASLQVLSVVSQFGILGLIIATIEWYRDRKDPLWKIL
jgi:hypothetical protein